MDLKTAMELHLQLEAEHRVSKETRTENYRNDVRDAFNSFVLHLIKQEEAALTEKPSDETV